MASGRVLALVVVLGGLRPDMVTADVMPNLVRFSGIATRFTNATTVFPGVTPVVAASFATGALPRGHGVVANEVFWPEVASDRALQLDDHRIVRAVDQTLGGRLVACATFADVLAAAGRRVEVVAAGASAAAHLLNPRAAQNRHWTFSNADRSASPTPAAWDETIARHGFPPEQELPRFDEVRYATDVMIDRLSAADPPDVGVLWLCEPGDSSRFRELGSQVAESAMRHVDRQLGRLLCALDDRQGLESALVIVASSHGGVTCVGEIDVAGLLRAVGLDADVGAEHSAAGRIVGSGSWGGSFAGDADRLAVWLQRQSWIGNIFARDDLAIPGSFPLSLAGLDHPRAPALVFTLASDLGLDQNGLPGRGLSMRGSVSAITTHGGLHPQEMSIVLFASGPGFRRGAASEAEVGIIDIAPTVLACAGLGAPESTAGRDLATAAMSARHSVISAVENAGYVQRLLVGSAQRAPLHKV